ncbi:endonuclease MutS2 [Paenibacillus thermoaerophilus]|uniref:Endonuclease MutS2 n=1 Tax=Paenibacillus thermoaerophilus TaxID=1215385 RepID=A0ABW2V243_9BACL|nr:endonuclease MutS2 [Paenibacillus thermoaerophilus]TMV15901.1 endonuclease MutS2 [Paenibacillus thermoaerophilus]
MKNDKVLHTLEYDKIRSKLADKASTSLGRAIAEQLRPVSSFEDVQRLLKETEEAVDVERLKGGVSFGGIRDIREPLNRARIGAMLSASELLDIATTIRGGRKLRKFLAAVHEDHPIPLLAALAGGISDQQRLEERITACIDDNAEVVDGASPELYRIRQELRTNEHRAREKLEQIIRSSTASKMLQDLLVTMRGDRYVIPVKAEYRSHFGGIVHDQSASGATLFIEPEAVVAINNKLRELKAKEEREIERILLNLSGLVQEVCDDLRGDIEALARLDFIFAKAGLARDMKATRPVMNNRGFIKLNKGRHPLIPIESAVPLDIELGRSYSMIIVTGPNTGGKTVALKTVGLLSLMAMSGLFVPAQEDSQLCVFDGVYADIGDEQSIEQSLSTFSSHLTNIISILREMTPKSLVLLDELGAGTDPTEGSALAIALLEHIRRMGCRVLATTHYSELKAYAYEREGVINASMEFDVATLSPTYRLLIGVPGRSNAFAIAERLGLPKRIIDHARGEVDEEDQRVETMIASLEANRLAAEHEREQAEALRREVQRLRSELEAERARFEAERDKLLAKAEEEARAAVAKARKEAEEIIADLRRLALEERSSIKEHKLVEAKRRLDQAEPELVKGKPQQAKRSDAAARLEPGDEVKVLSIGQRGFLIEPVGPDEWLVQMGIVKTKVKTDQLERVGGAGKQPSAAKSVTTVKRSRDEHVRTELDLRGANLEEAIIETDRFLDEAILAGLGQVYVIHGKGTGILRTGLQEFFRKHKHVRSFRLGHYGEGGAGVTVVELK